MQHNIQKLYIYKNNESKNTIKDKKNEGNDEERRPHNSNNINNNSKNNEKSEIVCQLIIFLHFVSEYTSV